MQRLEPFDIIAIILTIGGIGLLCVGAISNHKELFEPATYIIISMTSASVGKRWNGTTTDKKDNSNP